MSLRTLSLAVFLSFAALASCKVGILYGVWHASAAIGYQQAVAKGSTGASVESVIQSNGKMQLSDIYQKYGVDTANFMYQTIPELGYYCLVESMGCQNVSGVLRQHADQLTSAGIDFIVVDATNFPSDGTQTEQLAVLPTIALFEGWAALRASGVATPDISIWFPVNTGATLWQRWLSLVQTNSTYLALLHKDTATSKPIMFIVDSPGLPADPSIITQIEAQGFVVVKMWALLSQTQMSQGYWSFFSPCMDDGMTTSIIGKGCKQYVTTNSPLGSQMSVSPSYQLNYGSLPFGAPGRFRGLTLASQFVNAMSVQPDYLFVSSWNEFIAQPQPNPHTNINTAFSMGLMNDTEGKSLWVDTYGAEYGRDIEPSKDSGDFTYRLMVSCLRLYRAGHRSCDDASELCCQTLQQEQNRYVNIYSYANDVSSDRQLSTTTIGFPWRQICTPFTGPTTFCVSNSETQGQSAPFIMWAQPPSDQQSVAIYSCTVSNGKHFFSNQAGCENQHINGLLGYAAIAPSSEMARALIRCYSKSSGVHYHSLDIPCPPSDEDAGLYGYVR